MKKLSLNLQIFICAATGIAIGLWLQTTPLDSELRQNSLYLFGLIGTLFVDLLKMVLVPLVFTSIAVGVANLSAHQQIHRVWLTTLGFFMVSMAIAIILGLTAANIFEPGKNLNLALFHDAMQSFDAKQMTPSEFFQKFLHGLFVNPFSALADGNIIAIVIFALFIGIALVAGGDRYRNILVLLKEWLELILRMVG
jgi:Na+/H+-dicarboxylate symporter